MMPHLVLVDDDDLFRESVSLNLIDEGYQVTSFGNGRDALADLEGGGAGDVALLDWRMPDITRSPSAAPPAAGRDHDQDDLFNGAVRRHEEAALRCRFHR